MTSLPKIESTPALIAEPWSRKDSVIYYDRYHQLLELQQSAIRRSLTK